MTASPDSDAGQQDVDPAPDSPDRCQGDCDRKAGKYCHLAWSPAFGAWLCARCRESRVETELGVTERANARAAFKAAGLSAGTPHGQDR